MEETNTTELYVDYMISGYAPSEESIQSLCISEGYRLPVISGVCTVICLCGILGNTLVVWFLGFHMKKSPFTVYVLNLAIADFSLLLFLLAVITLVVIEAAYCIYSFQALFTNYMLTTLFLFWYFASMYLLTAISIERCLSGLFPIWYRCHRPRHLSGIVCGVLWALAGLFVSLLFFVIKDYEHLLVGVSIANCLVISLLPLLSSLSLLIKLRCGSQRKRPGRLYVAILLSAIFLFLFGFPLSVTFFRNPFYLNWFYPNTFSLLASLNSSINPLIYFLVGSWRHRRFQGSVKVAFRRLFEEKVTSEEGNHVSGDTTAVTAV